MSERIVTTYIQTKCQHPVKIRCLLLEADSKKKNIIERYDKIIFNVENHT